MISHDIIIVGAGPAGVSASIKCGKEGMNVCLIDKKAKNEIGNKVCGEAISKKSVIKVSGKLGIECPKGEEINAPIETMVLNMGKDSMSSLTYPSIGYMIDRHIYGQRLLQEALDVGVNLYESVKVLQPIIKDKKVIGVKTKGKDGIKEVHGHITIDSSGLRSVVRTNLPRDFDELLYTGLKREEYSSCYREIIKLKEGEHEFDKKIVLKYDDSIPEPAYFWIFGDGPKKLNCGTGFMKVGKNSNLSVKKVYNKYMKKLFPTSSYSIIDSRGDVVPTRPPLLNAVSNGLLIAGDAGFHANPLTAEGHGPALLAGFYAGETAVEAILAENYSKTFLWNYNKKIIREFGCEHFRDAITTFLLTKLGRKNIEFLIKKKVITQRDLTSDGQTNPLSHLELVKRLLRCFPKLSLLLQLKKGLDAHKKMNQLCQEYPSVPSDLVIWQDKITKLYSSFN